MWPNSHNSAGAPFCANDRRRRSPTNFASGPTRISRPPSSHWRFPQARARISAGKAGAHRAGLPRVAASFVRSLVRPRRGRTKRPPAQTGSGPFRARCHCAEPPSISAAGASRLELGRLAAAMNSASDGGSTVPASIRARPVDPLGRAEPTRPRQAAKVWQKYSVLGCRCDGSTSSARQFLCQYEERLR